MERPDCVVRQNENVTNLHTLYNIKQLYKTSFERSPPFLLPWCRSGPSVQVSLYRIYSGVVDPGFFQKTCSKSTGFFFLCFLCVFFRLIILGIPYGFQLKMIIKKNTLINNTGSLTRHSISITLVNHNIT